jgi:guanyl-specific ribonuclease Sa
VLVVLLLVGLAFLRWHDASAAGPTSPTVSRTSSAGASPARPSGSTTRRPATRTSATLPATAQTAGSGRARAEAVLALVEATGKAPPGYVGGRQFMNDGRGGTTALPRAGSDGRLVVYHEYDVNPYVRGVDRGPQRLVVGQDGSAYYTGDHYRTWTRLR